MLKIKKGDTVQIIKGRDKGKKGKIIMVSYETKRALVEGMNMVKKHKRKTSQDQQGGIVSIESPISVSNLMLVCKTCNKPVRVTIKKLDDNSKVRMCKSCKETL